MFNIGFEELIVILLVAFLVVGPKNLPKVARSIGRGVRRVKAMFEEFKEETGLDEAEKEFEKTTNELNKTIKDADPTSEIRKVQQDTQKSINEVKKSVMHKDNK